MIFSKRVFAGPLAAIFLATSPIAGHAFTIDSSTKKKRLSTSPGNSWGDRQATLPERI